MAMCGWRGRTETIIFPKKILVQFMCRPWIKGSTTEGGSHVGLQWVVGASGLVLNLVKVEMSRCKIAPKPLERVEVEGVGLWGLRKWRWLEEI